MDLDAIEQRTRAATEGPWEYDGRTLWGRDSVGRIKADTPADKEFIVATRTDVPALVARVRELEEENQRNRQGGGVMDLDAIEARRVAYRASHDHLNAFACCTAHASADDVPDLMARVRELEEVVKRLGSLHHPGPEGDYHDECMECGARWPCATKKATSKALKGEN